MGDLATSAVGSNTISGSTEIQNLLKKANTQGLTQQEQQELSQLLASNGILSSNANANSNVNFSSNNNVVDINAAPSASAPTAPATTSADGADDGKISLLDKAKNLLIGIPKEVGKFVCSVVPFASPIAKACGWKNAPDFSFLSLGMTAATIVLLLIPGTQPLGVALAIGGGLMAGGQIIGGFNKAANAKTDAEAEEAWQEIGGGGLQLGLAIAGAKAGVNAMGEVEGSEMAALAAKASSSESKLGFIESIKSFGEAFGKDFKSSLFGGKGYDGLTPLTNLKTNIQSEGLIDGFKQSVSDAGDSIKTGYNKFKGTDVETGETNSLRTALKNRYNDLKEAGIESNNAKIKEVETAKGNVSKAVQETGGNIESTLKSRIENLDYSDPKSVKALLKDIKNSKTLSNTQKADLAKAIKTAQSKVKAVDPKILQAETDYKNAVAENMESDEYSAEWSSALKDTTQENLAKLKADPVEGAKSKIASATKETIIDRATKQLEAYENSPYYERTPSELEALLKNKSANLTKAQISDIKDILRLKKILDGNINPFGVYSTELLQTGAATTFHPTFTPTMVMASNQNDTSQQPTYSFAQMPTTQLSPLTIETDGSAAGYHLA